MCAILGVSTSAYYDWCKLTPTARTVSDLSLTDKVNSIFTGLRESCGTRPIKKVLSRAGQQVSRRRIGRLMEESGLRCKTRKKFKATTNSKHSHPVAENILNREFSVTQPNKVWVGDITYIWTGEGWLYLATVIDLCSRRVVGFSLSNRMTTDLVNNALMAAILSRKPPKGLIWHTDRGSQYASVSHREKLDDYGIIQSMSRKGNCWDNAVAESFFHTLKTELVHHKQYKTRAEAEQDIFEYIEVFYNRRRLHSTNDYLSPVRYEQLQNVM